MIQLLLIFLGGGLGSLSRFGVSKILDYRIFEFPLATLVSNTIACLFLGYILGVELKNGISDSTKLLAITGFCGGFSTFSTFSAESVKLLTEGQVGLAILNVLVSLITCFVCIFIGMKLGL